MVRWQMFVQKLNRFSPRCTIEKSSQMTFIFDGNVFCVDAAALECFEHAATGGGRYYQVC